MNIVLFLTLTLKLLVINHPCVLDGCHGILTIKKEVNLNHRGTTTYLHDIPVFLMTGAKNLCTCASVEIRTKKGWVQQEA